MQAAAKELAGLGPVGIQLTPGCAPTGGFREWIDAQALATRTHHGFCWHALRRAVWDEAGNLCTADDSVHPPRSDTAAAKSFWDTAPSAPTLFETMYPGYVLGNGAELERAMDARLGLAIDVSHLFIQRESGVLSDRALRRTFDYDNIGEVHVSANDGRSDQHRAIGTRTFGLAWAIERTSAQVPLVLESYMHKLSFDDRRMQVELLLNKLELIR
jgi:sugar phosphate isomerase/epimerase